MKKLTAREVPVPLTVPPSKRDLYCQRYIEVTRATGRLFLFAADQKIEHLNKSFYGNGIPKECGHPEHLFTIASQSPIGVFATQLGMIARYGSAHLSIPYLVKLNSKTNLAPQSYVDPLSRSLQTVDQVVQFAELNKANIVGVGYTIYLGSKYESLMLQEAAQIVYQAHMHGLLVVLWMYPRGQSVKQERHADVIAGAAGVATALGADFAKVIPPDAPTSKESAELLQQASRAGGSTQLICSGGTLISQKDFLQQLHDQIHIGGASGAAVGRNVHQRTLVDAKAFCNAIAAIIYQDVDVSVAMNLMKKGS